MSILTLLFLLAFVAMIAMHLRGGGHAGHGGGNGGCCGGHSDGHDDAHDPSVSVTDTQTPQEPRQPVGTSESHDGHSGLPVR
jgi:hypothetical protein